MKIENRRKFFEDYAKMFGFDPQQAENWYSQSKDQVMLCKVSISTLFFLRIILCFMKGAAGVLYYHNYNLPQALLDLFPDIGLAKEYFRRNCMLSICIPQFL